MAQWGTPALLPLALQEPLQPCCQERRCSRESQELQMQHPLTCSSAHFPGLWACTATQHLQLRTVPAETLVFHG